MHIQCTDQAIHEINRQIGNQQVKLKLAYDAEGCGCIVSGIAQLWIVDEPGEFDQLTSNTSRPILYDRRHEVFFEEQLIIDYQPEKKCFILKSNNQIYNSGMRIIEKRLSHLK